MHIDAMSLAADTLLEGDICIVGAGAAGIAAALELRDTPFKVLLLEGGGFDLEPQLQRLYQGEIVGLPYYPLEAARLHYFGGTTGHWGGFCAPLDPVDFTARSWIPNSGWPMTRDQLNPYYTRAQEMLELGPFEYEASYWQARDPRRVRLPFDASVVREKIWQFSPPSRFGWLYRDAIVGSANIHLYTHANVCEIETNETASAVTGLVVRHFDGRSLRVRADRYVLACSTLQNVRLLLASNARASAGLGNQHDVVGRYFMEHLEMPVGTAAMMRAQSMHLYAMDFGFTKARAELALTEQQQQAHGLLNASVAFEPAPVTGEAKTTFESNTPDEVEEFRRTTASGISADMQEAFGGETSHTAEAVAQHPFFSLTTRQEQAPNKDSRVTLSNERDALGVPRARLDWRLSPLDKHTMRTTLLTLAREFGRSGVGRVQLRDYLRSEDAEWQTTVSGGWHHMGATRMADNPKFGVVDANLKVHDMANLYVTGGGVFPTGGSANPTLTIVALAVRLAAHLRTLPTQRNDVR